MSGDDWTIAGMPKPPPALPDLTEVAGMVIERDRLAKTAPTALTRSERDVHTEAVEFGKKLIERITAAFEKTDDSRVERKQEERRRA